MTLLSQAAAKSRKIRKYLILTEARNTQQQVVCSRLRYPFKTDFANQGKMGEKGREMGVFWRKICQFLVILRKILYLCSENRILN